MTDTKIKELAADYIGGVEHDDRTTAEDREAAVERIEAASRELLAATQEQRGTLVAC
jgi:hypothetical protein